MCNHLTWINWASLLILWGSIMNTEDNFQYLCLGNRFSTAVFIYSWRLLSTGGIGTRIHTARENAVDCFLIQIYSNINWPEDENYSSLVLCPSMYNKIKWRPQHVVASCMKHFHTIKTYSGWNWILLDWCATGVSLSRASCRCTEATTDVCCWATSPRVSQRFENGYLYHNVICQAALWSFRQTYCTKQYRLEGRITVSKWEDRVTGVKYHLD